MKIDTQSPTWQVHFTPQALRQTKTLPERISLLFARLINEMEIDGPYRNEWLHFGPLKKEKKIPENSYHCHIKSGHPTYVVCWQVTDRKIQILEIYYVGTHEAAPYCA